MQLVMICPIKDFEAQDHSAQLENFRQRGQGDDFQVVWEPPLGSRHTSLHLQSFFCSAHCHISSKWSDCSHLNVWHKGYLLVQLSYWAQQCSWWSKSTRQLVPGRYQWWVTHCNLFFGCTKWQMSCMRMCFCLIADCSGSKDFSSVHVAAAKLQRRTWRFSTELDAC